MACSTQTSSRTPSASKPGETSLETQAAVVHQRNGRFLLEDIALSAPREHEVIVELEASGMCHADLAARAGDIPFPLPGVLGHEGVGRVVDKGSSVREVAVGERVVVSFSSCGHCPACERAASVYCRDWPRLNLVGGSRADGSATIVSDSGPIHGHFFGQSSFSRHLVASERAVVKVPDDLPASILAPLGCGIQTGVSAALSVLCPAPGARVAVSGVGAVGMSAIMGLRLTAAAQVIAMDMHPARLELARELGATATINAASGDVAGQIEQLTDGRGLDGVIETSGNTGALKTAIQSLASAGTCVTVGVPGAEETVDIHVVDLVARGIRLLGTNQGDAVPRVFIPQLIELYRRGVLPIEKLITSFDFAEINEAASASLAGQVIKPVLHMN